MNKNKKVEEFDIYLGTEVDDQVAWGTVKYVNEEENLITVYLEGEEILSFLAPTNRMKEIYCDE